MHEPVILSQVAAQSPYSIWLVRIDRVQPSFIAGVSSACEWSVTAVLYIAGTAHGNPSVYIEMESFQCPVL